MEPSILDPAEALALTADPEGVGPLVDEPVLSVRFDSSPEFSRFAARAETLPCVTIAVGGGQPSRSGLDVEVASASEAGLVDAAVRASPQAATVLVQLLRLGSQLDLHAALVAESLAYGLLQTGMAHREWIERQPERTHVSSDQPVRIKRAGDVMTCTLARARVHNAFDAGMRDGIVEAFSLALADSEIERIELRGEGPSFCSGGDLSEFGTTPSPLTAHFVRTTRSAAWTIAQCAAKTTSFLHGSCIGAGIELAALSNRLIATSDTTISLPEVAMGLIPGAGGTASLPRRIGRQRTAWLGITGAVIDASTALDWGLVDEIADA